MQNHRKYPFVQNTGTLKPENIRLNWNYIWDTLEIDLKEVIVTFNDNKINLQIIITIKLRDKIKIRNLMKMMKKEPLFFHIMFKQGITLFTSASGAQETV